MAGGFTALLMRKNNEKRFTEKQTRIEDILVFDEDLPRNSLVSFVDFAPTLKYVKDEGLKSVAYAFDDSNISGVTQLKSTVQKAIKAKLCQQFPNLTEYIDEILPKKEAIKTLKCHEHIEVVVGPNGEHLFFRQRDGPYLPTLRLIHKYPFICPLMQVDRGAITFVLSGANVMCPGLTSKGAIRTPDLPVDSVVTVIAEGKQSALSVGVLKMSSNDIAKINRGIAVENVHFLNDGLWRLKPVK